MPFFFVVVSVDGEIQHVILSWSYFLLVLSFRQLLIGARKNGVMSYHKTEREHRFMWRRLLKCFGYNIYFVFMMEFFCRIVRCLFHSILCVRIRIFDWMLPIKKSHDQHMARCFVMHFNRVIDTLYFSFASILVWEFL